jgi:protein TonB
MTFDQPRKNYSGFAFIAVLHAALFAIAVQHSTVWINRDESAPPIEVKPLPPEPNDPAPPDSSTEQFKFTERRPVTELPLVPPQINTATIPEGTLTPRPADASPVVAMERELPPARHEPVRVAPVADVHACAKPAYPQSSLRNGDSGTVTLAFLIGADGKVADSRVERSSGFRDLDRAAMTGLAQCRFKPGTVDGVAYESWMRMQYVWSLDE